MVRSLGVTVSIFAYLLSFGSTSAIPSTNSIQSRADNSTGWTHLWISGDGSQIVPIDGPKDIAHIIANGLLGAGHGDSYTYSFINYHGVETPRPGLAKFLFDCEFGLFTELAGSGQCVTTPYPNGKYVCGQGHAGIPGMVRMSKLEDPYQWNMTYKDLSFLLKVVHDVEAVKDEVPFFDFWFGYTNNTGLMPHERIINGEWTKSYGSTAAISTS